MLILSDFETKTQDAHADASTIEGVESSKSPLGLPRRPIGLFLAVVQSILHVLAFEKARCCAVLRIIATRFPNLKFVLRSGLSPSILVFHCAVCTAYAIF